MAEKKYCDYFKVDEKYFPAIDESAIKNGAPWQATYPHETFIKLLITAEKMLSGSTNKALWIHGAYGTGKSLCAYTLQKLLEVSESEVRDYWAKYEPLSKDKNLLEKFIGHKNHGVITAYRYASGEIANPRQLFFAIQESIQASLDSHNIEYKGQNSLRESVIEWLEVQSHKNFIDDILRDPKWANFPKSSSDEIINSLKKGGEVSELIDNIFLLAQEERITAFNLTADSLLEWISDILDRNKIKIVFIWDEFSDYFRQNSTTLSEFQKIVSLCQNKPFYFVIVTHPLTSIAKIYNLGDTNSSWRVIQDRFDKIEIELPDNIAFNLIGHAFTVKDPAKNEWDFITEDLNSRVSSARNAVKKAAGIANDSVMREILPIHPMSALILKNIASAFKSNQRSMFEFIKTSNDVKAFQYFINNTSPFSDRPILTVDMLWNFFYENGKDSLSQNIRSILDSFSKYTDLHENEKIVLKTVLIMQAVNTGLGSNMKVLQPTDQNLSYAFEGDTDEIAISFRVIIKNLVKKGVLMPQPIGEGKTAYAAATLTGTDIDEIKARIRDTTTTAKLIDECPEIASALNLSPALKLRYALDPDSGKIPIASITSFKKVMDSLKNKTLDWHFFAVMIVAKTEEEAKSFRKLIQDTIKNSDYKNITVIDALSSYLGLEDFEQYVDFSAAANYYQGSDRKQSESYAAQAKNVLASNWKDRITHGKFFVFSYANQEGEQALGADSVQAILRNIVLNRFKYIQDFTRGITESQLKLTQAKKSAKFGIDADKSEVSGIIKGCEKIILSKFWSRPEYWKDKSLANESIVIIKQKIDEILNDSFTKYGKISIGEIYEYLESEFGFSQSNLSAFIAGFLLKEYSFEPYRYMDSDGHTDTMNSDRLSEMIGNYIGKNPKPVYIASLTDDERAFYKYTEEAFNFTKNFCSSPSQTSQLVLNKMRNLSFPVWCLEEIAEPEIFEFVKLYISLVQSKGDEAHDIANEIGRIFLRAPESAQKLKMLLTIENCKTGMLEFLKKFENGKLLTLANEVGASDLVLSDVKKLFSVQYSALWQKSTGEDEIRKLITDYEVVKLTNILINSAAKSREIAFNAWRDTLKFVNFSHESISDRRPETAKFFEFLLKIAKHDDILPENMKVFLSEMKAHNPEIKYILDNNGALFREIYAPYLENFSESECEEVRNSIKSEMFTMSSTSSNAAVKNAAEIFRQSQKKTQLYKFWRDKTGTRTPREWSAKYRTPILCCIRPEIFTQARRVFAVLNNFSQNEKDIADSLEFLNKSDFFEDINSPEFRDSCFAKYFIEKNSCMLPDIDSVRDILESTGKNAYDWYDDPEAKNKIAAKVQSEYYSGGSDKAVSIIDTMNESELKRWLIELVRKNSALGIQIINNRESAL